jgi:hydroxymethylpyrimidine pyrophosphatase-like HAD family hydrolase
MLEYAGIGVALDNAHEDVKAIAGKFIYWIYLFII